MLIVPAALQVPDAVLAAPDFRLAGQRVGREGMAGLGLAIALAGLIPRRAWRLGRLAVTAVHEGGHAVAAILAGRKVQAVHLRADASGVTVHQGSRSRRGRLLTAAAGYPAPGILGAAGAWLVANQHARWWLIALAGMGAVMAVLWVRNLFGLAMMMVWVAGLGWLLASGSVVGETLAGAAVAWYLVLGGMRAVAELLGDRSHSDASDLARLTRVPTVVCKAAFAILAAGAVAGCAALFFGGP